MFDPADIGTRYDDPADASALQAGEPATLFALLKGLLIKMHELNERPDVVTAEAE